MHRTRNKGLLNFKKIRECRCIDDTSWHNDTEKKANPKKVGISFTA